MWHVSFILFILSPPTISKAHLSPLLFFHLITATETLARVYLIIRYSLKEWEWRRTSLLFFRMFTCIHSFIKYLLNIYTVHRAEDEAVQELTENVFSVDLPIRVQAENYFIIFTIELHKDLLWGKGSGPCEIVPALCEAAFKSMVSRASLLLEEMKFKPRSQQSKWNSQPEMWKCDFLLRIN